MLKALKISNQKIRDVLIIGGSKIAVYLAEELIKSGVNVKIIEQSLKSAAHFRSVCRAP